MISVENLQLSVKKLQLPASPPPNSIDAQMVSSWRQTNNAKALQPGH